MSDFNAKIDKEKSGEFIGDVGLGIRNERGEKLKLFAEEEEELVILNLFFKLPPLRLYTWISAQEQLENIVRNQIGYVLVNKRFRNSCISVKKYPCADVSSDHIPLVNKFKKVTKKNSNDVL